MIKKILITASNGRKGIFHKSFEGSLPDDTVYGNVLRELQNVHAYVMDTETSKKFYIHNKHIATIEIIEE